MNKRTIARFYGLVVGLLCFMALLALAMRWLFGMDSTVLLEGILSILGVLALGLGYWVAKTPKEIPSLGDPTLDAEIDRTLRSRAPKSKEK